MWQGSTERAAMQQASGQPFEERAARHAINQEQ
jgi:hypothetical protein